jgi:hypothetical protein
MSRQRFQRDKFKELILYLATKHEDEEFWGKTKLNKCLFYSDFMAFERFGEPITGAAYVALERGPAPKAMVPVQREMVESREIAVQVRGAQHRIVALREPDLSDFSAQEIALVDHVIERTRMATADMLSEHSHGFLGWQAARAEAIATQKQVAIPYSTAFVSSEPPDEFEIAHGRELAKQHGWPV